MVAGYKSIDRNGTVTYYVKSTDDKPTLNILDAGHICVVVDDTLKTVVSIWVWYGTDWAQY